MERVYLKDVDRKNWNSNDHWQMQLTQELSTFPYKLIVLDDDPTGTQTVHDISVYTDWSVATLREGFAEEANMFYVLTNSRAMSESTTEKLHQEIAKNILVAAEDRHFLIISRGDSTLRGHYPLETKTIKETIERDSHIRFDGEIICPFFAEGNRVTVNDTHYIKQGEELQPVGESEFAKDRTFGYRSSNLKDWINEKSHQSETVENISSLDLVDIRQGQLDKMVSILCETNNFSKVVVNALDNDDLTIVALAIIKAIKLGKNFIFRTAAALPRALSGMEMAPLLTGDDLIEKENKNGGLVIVGSHVKKSTLQLEALKTLPNLVSVEMNTDLVLKPGLMLEESERVLKEVETNLARKANVVVYTKRERLDLGENMAAEELALSVKISEAVTKIIRDLKVRPSFMIAKGGITSSQIATEGLKIKKGEVLGQIKGGIPVWRADTQSKFPNMSYIIFPGNVGSDNDLKEIVATLDEARR